MSGNYPFAAGAIDSLMSFIIPLAPTILSVTPTSGDVAGGGVLSISGQNLRGLQSITFGGVPALGVQVQSDTAATCVIPAGAGVGQVDIVFTLATGSSTLSSGYTYTSSNIEDQPSADPTPPFVPTGYASIYTRMAKTAQRLILKYTTGSVVIMREVSVMDPTDPTNSSVSLYTSSPIPAVVEGYSDKQVNGDTIHAGDRRLYIAANDLQQIPLKSDIITIDQVRHAVVSVQQIMAAGQICLYVVQARTAGG